MLRALTFEITGTLVCMSLPLGSVYGNALRHYKLPCPDDETMKQAFIMAYKSTGAALPNYGAAAGMSERRWWDTMIKSTLKEARCDEALEEDVFPLVFQRIYSSFGSSDVWAPCLEGQRAMAHAKKAGLVVGACSNVYHRYVDSNLPLLGLHRDLDFAATSYSFGEAKPSPKMYREAARQASVAARLIHGSGSPIAPAEMLHVGDDLKNDYLAAKAVGMHSLLYDPNGETAPSDKIPAEDIIKSLDEVPTKVDALMREWDCL